MSGHYKIDPSESEGNIDQNKREYGDGYDALQWIDGAKVDQARTERADLIGELVSRGVLFSHGGTKLDVRRLSPGCRACGSGNWSCLFINGICNMRCFYCPTGQAAEEVPQTNTVPFADPRDYADYLERFGFTGVSMSGGEPLMTYEKTLRYIRMVRQHLGDKVHLWMYTNGTLTSEERLHTLRDAGLNEIRFDIGSLGYRLAPVSLAVGIFDVVTVEIPAIPEDAGLLGDKVSQLKEIGVDYLNLHQLRLTPYNYRHLSKRNYTFLHGPKVTVLESELTALKVMLRTLERGIDLPVNYCSFIYKHTYQKAAARRRGAELIRKPHEGLTDTGLIRNLSIRGSADDISACTDRLAGIPGAEGLWSLESGKERLRFNASLWRHIDFTRVALIVRYDITAITPELSYGYVFKTVELNKRRKIYVERRPLGPETVLARDAIECFGRNFLGHETGTGAVQGATHPDTSEEAQRVLAGLARFETYPEGLAHYY
ncbi:MAG: radical SAM protein [Syntrophobacterales bacterium]|nr:MAG: radical SAM protein [Syntrophobacterales bacterium]